MREQAQVRQAEFDETAAAREDPAGARPTAAEDSCLQGAADPAHVREQLARHAAALAVARTNRVGAVPLRRPFGSQPLPQRGTAWAPTTPMGPASKRGEVVRARIP
ncbi:hypothetical protein GCM10009665_54670 [Kitasatospora nipponensis]|uniref:Uncharacterized protein n=1 Tax=Kitasatospora nipponensis TaxID=258049 RepID=A0ABN1WUJ1_9ACTN